MQSQWPQYVRPYWRHFDDQTGQRLRTGQKPQKHTNLDLAALPVVQVRLAHEKVIAVHHHRSVARRHQPIMRANLQSFHASKAAQSQCL
jgi:hypothetical protein